MNIVKSSLFYMIYGMSLISLSVIIVISLLWPKDNLFSGQMIIGVSLTTILFLLCFIVWGKVRFKFHNFSILYPVLIVLYAVTLYVVNCIGRNEPRSLVDYGIVWGNAWEMAKENRVIDPEYFLTYSNNIKPMLFLSFLFRIAFKLGMEDPFYFILIISVIEVIVAIWGVIVLTENAKTKDCFRIPILCFFCLCLPIWANTQAFYTDAMSFAFAIVVLAFIKLALQTEKTTKKILFSALAGMLFALGIVIKVTVCIPLIAAAIVCFFVCDRSKAKKIFAVIITGGIGFVVVFFLLECWANSYEVTRLSKETADPAIAWVALGLKGDGSWEQNSEFVYSIHGLASRMEKVAASQKYIWENRSYFFDLDHIIQKVRCNYASGHLGNTDYTYFAKYESNILWELFAPYGRYFWRTSQISFCYIQAMYTVCFIGNILSIVQYKKEKKISYTLMIADLSMLGYFLFLMLWEANNRQLYNLAPILITGTVLHAHQIIKWGSEVVKRIVQRSFSY